MWKCNECGKTNLDQDIKCFYCDTYRPGAGISKQDKSLAKKIKIHRKKYISIAIAVVCLVLCAKIFYGLGADSTQEEQSSISDASEEIEVTDNDGNIGAETADEEAVELEPTVEPTAETQTLADKYDVVRDNAVYSGEMRDNNGVVYEVYLYADNPKMTKSSYDTKTVWAGANEGDMLCEGNFTIVYKNKNTDVIQEIAVSNDVKTINLSRQLCKVQTNKFSTGSDFFIFAETEASDIINMQIYQIINGSIKLLTVKDGENTSSFLITCGTQTPFFNQVSSDYFEVAAYDNTKTFRYYLYTFQLFNGSCLVNTRYVYSMNVVQFKQYFNVSVSGNIAGIKEDSEQLPMTQEDEAPLTTLGLEMLHIQFDTVKYFDPDDTVRISFEIKNISDRIKTVRRKNFVVKHEGDNVVKAAGDSGGFDSTPNCSSPTYTNDSVELYPEDVRKVSLDFQAGKAIQFNSGYALYYVDGDKLVKIQDF